MTSNNPVRTASFVVAAILLLLVCLPPSAMAQEEEHKSAPPPEGCLGSNDPYCDTGGDGDDEFDYDCHVCEYIPEGPDGEPSFHACVVDNGCCETELRECQDGTYACYHDGYCVYT